MHNNFSFQRLLQLIHKEWIENRRMYLMSALALFAILAVVVGFWLSSSGDNYRQDGLLGIGLFGLFFSGTIFASTAFNMLNSKEKGTYWLSFPASHLEKLLCVIFFNVIVFSIVYFVCFIILKFFAESYIHQLVAKNPSKYDYELTKWKGKNNFGQAFPIFIFGFYILQSIFLLGAVTLKRFAFVGTAVVVIAVFFAWLFLTNKLVGTLYTNDNFNFSLNNIKERFASVDTYKIYKLDPVLQNIFEVLLKYCLIPFFWFVTWLKLKEKEI